MEIKKKIKKGFTLIELVVVIAVIAILSAVSVAAYFGVINSSRKSNDTQELSSLKTAWFTELLANSEQKASEKVTESEKSVTYTFTLSHDGGKYGLTVVGSSSSNDASTPGFKSYISQALTLLAGDDWNTSAYLGVEYTAVTNATNTQTISKVYYARNVTPDSSTYKGDWACWDISADTVTTASETTPTKDNVYHYVKA